MDLQQTFMPVFLLETNLIKRIGAGKKKKEIPVFPKYQVVFNRHLQMRKGPDTASKPFLI